MRRLCSIVRLGLIGGYLLILGGACQTEQAAREETRTDTSSIQEVLIMEEREEYKGRIIEISAHPAPEAADTTAAAGDPAEAHGLEGGTPLTSHQLTIDGQPVQVFQTSEGTFFTEYLPFQTYDDLMTLAKELVDAVPEFRPMDATDQ